MTSSRRCAPGGCFLAALLAPLLSATPMADDWPQWRGPNRDGMWRESGILEAMPRDGLKVRNDRELVCASLAADQTTRAEVEKPSPAARSRVFTGPAGPLEAFALAFSPDGKTLALGTDWGVVKLLELATGKELAAPRKHKYQVDSVTFSADGALLASAGGNEFQHRAEVRLWDVAAGKERGQLVGHKDKLLSAAFSPDNKKLVTAGADQTVRIWDVTTMKERNVLKGHTDAVWSVAFSADGRTVASAGWDRTVKLWDATAGQQRSCLCHPWGQPSGGR